MEKIGLKVCHRFNLICLIDVMKEKRLDILQKVANGELTPEQADEQLLGLSIVGVSLPIESFDVDDWLGKTHGVWYHPLIELHNYDNGNKKSIELSQLIADYANSIIQNKLKR